MIITLSKREAEKLLKTKNPARMIGRTFSPFPYAKPSKDAIRETRPVYGPIVSVKVVPIGFELRF